jgi:hypothetical protein
MIVERIACRVIRKVCRDDESLRPSGNGPMKFATARPYARHMTPRLLDFVIWSFETEKSKARKRGVPALFVLTISC